MHHTTKQKKSDSFESISGSNGLLGCADGAFVMEKESRLSFKATIDVVSRDITDQKLILIKDEKSLIWDLKLCVMDGVKEQSIPILKSIAKVVNWEHPKWEGTATQLCNEIQSDMAPNILTRKLNVYADILNREFCVNYSRETKHKGRVITLTYSPRSGSQQKIDGCDDQNAAPQADMTTESGSDATGEVTRDGCDDSKTIQPTAVTFDSAKVVDDKVVVCECRRDACNDKNTLPSAVVAGCPSEDTANESVCEDKRDDCNDKNIVPSAVVAGCSG